MFDSDFFVNQQPEGYYQQFIEKRQPKQRRKHLSGLFTNIQRDYNKALVKFAVENRGQSPLSRQDLSTFRGFLENFDLEDKYFESALGERDPNQQAFNPRTQFLFNR